MRNAARSDPKLRILVLSGGGNPEDWSEKCVLAKLGGPYEVQR